MNKTSEGRNSTALSKKQYCFKEEISITKTKYCINKFEMLYKDGKAMSIGLTLHTLCCCRVAGCQENVDIVVSIAQCGIMHAKHTRTHNYSRWTFFTL